MGAALIDSRRQKAQHQDRDRQIAPEGIAIPAGGATIPYPSLRPPSLLLPHVICRGEQFFFNARDGKNAAGLPVRSLRIPAPALTRLYATAGVARGRPTRQFLSS